MHKEKRAAHQRSKCGLAMTAIAAVVLFRGMPPLGASTLAGLFLALAFLQGIPFALIFGSLCVLARYTQLSELWILIGVMGTMMVLSSCVELFLKAEGETGYCRPPLKPRLSVILSYHIVHSVWLEAAFVALLYSGVVQAERYQHRALLFNIVLALPICLVARYGLANNTIRLAKRILDSRFRIVILRRFSKESAASLSRLILPTLGAYGRIIAIYDDWLAVAPSADNADSAEILAERYAAIHCDDASWRETVSNEITSADLVVFHWPNVPTANMIWEYREACRYMPQSRMVWICHPNSVSAVVAWLSSQPIAPDLGQVLECDASLTDSKLRGLVYGVFSRLGKDARPEFATA
jgi:hypothetical protein